MTTNLQNTDKSIIISVRELKRFLRTGGTFCHTTLHVGGVEIHHPLQKRVVLDALKTADPDEPVTVERSAHTIWIKDTKQMHR